MTDSQWNTLLRVIKGENINPVPVGFIIDSPWLPQWYGISIMDYFASEDNWFEANLKACSVFPEVLFFPGFWSEFGMATEPSAFGCKCSFYENALPHAHPVVVSVDDIDHLKEPDPATDGLLPFVLKRLIHQQQKIEQTGHAIRFAVSRGPLNIASYLMGTTGFMMLIMTDPVKTHQLLRLITSFLKRWLELQKKLFPSIDGIFILDDIIGFIGEPEFCEYALPYFKEIFSLDVSVKFLHNDASCEASLKYLPAMGVNLFNMGYDTDLNVLKEKTNNRVALMGNLPPRDVLAQETPAGIRNHVKKMKSSLHDNRHIIFSCGGGMPMGVSTENIKAFVEAVVIPDK